MQNEFVLETKPSIECIIDADSAIYTISWHLSKILNIEEDKIVGIPTIVYNTVHSFIDRFYEIVPLGTKLQFHFTASEKNKELFESFTGDKLKPQFRTLLGNYKQNRVVVDSPIKLPFMYHKILEVFLHNYTCYIHDQWEADDAVVLLKKLNPDWFLFANDKDVYRQSYGNYFNYDKRWKHGSTSKEEANRFRFIQAITGDPVDGYYGAQGLGIKYAEKALQGLESASDMWDTVVRSYESVGLTIDDAILNMRFADMHQLTSEGTIKLFEPDKVEHAYK